MSDAKRRKQAVCVSAGRGVVGRWVVRKLESQVVFGVRDFVAVSWADIWAAGSDIALFGIFFQSGGLFLHCCTYAVLRTRSHDWMVDIFHGSSAQEIPCLLN